MVFLVNERNELILAKRSTKKSLWSDYWDATIVSHILPGETPEAAAKRRGREEMGIEIEFRTVGAFYYFAKHNDSAENEYCYVLAGKVKGEVYPNPIEIKEVKEIPLVKLSEFIRKNTEDITPWLKLALEKFDLRRIYEDKI
jgi:isopentenyl-diphosphate delta-isomerase type 1